MKLALFPRRSVICGKVVHTSKCFCQQCTTVCLPLWALSSLLEKPAQLWWLWQLQWAICGRGDTRMHTHVCMLGNGFFTLLLYMLLLCQSKWVCVGTECASSCLALFACPACVTVKSLVLLWKKQGENCIQILLQVSVATCHSTEKPLPGHPLCTVLGMTLTRSCAHTHTQH